MANENKVQASKESLKTMGTWKRRVMEKKGKGRSESGRSKGLVATPLERTMCRRNRSWKDPLYEFVMDKLTGEKRKKGK